MPKQRSQTQSKKSHISPAKAHERAVDAWRTKHMRYHYGLRRIAAPHRSSLEDLQLGEGFHETDPDSPSMQDAEDLAQERALRDLQTEKIGTVQERRSNRGRANTKAWKKLHQEKQEKPEKLNKPPKITGTEGLYKTGHGAPQDVLNYIDYVEGIPDAQRAEELRRREEEDELVKKFGFVHEVKLGARPEEYRFVPAGDGTYFALENPNITAKKPTRIKPITHDPATGLEFKDERGNAVIKRIGIYDNPNVVLDSIAREGPAGRALTREELAQIYKENMRSYRETKGDKFDRTVEKHARDRNEKGYWKAQHEQFWNSDKDNPGQLQVSKNRYTNANYNKGWSLFSNDGKYGKKAGGNDFGLDSAEERVIKTNSWELVEPSHENKNAKDQLVFKLKREVPLDAELKEMDEDEMIETTLKETVNDVLADYNLSSGMVVNRKDDGTITVTSEEGKRINPAHAAAVQLALDEKFGVQDFERKGPAMRMKQKVIGVDANSNTDERDIAYNYKRATQGSRIGDREVVRDSAGNITGLGDLKDGEVDRIAFNLKLPGTDKEQKAYLNLQERSDSIGFGADYRPGEKQLNQVLTARAKNEYLADAHAAHLAAEEGNEGLLTKMALERNPDIMNNDGTMNEEELAEKKKQLKELGAAGISASAYAMRNRAQNTWPKRAAHKSERVGKFVDKYSIPFLGQDPDAELFIKPLGQKLDEAVWRVAHPLSSPHNPRASTFEAWMPETTKHWRYRSYFATAPEGMSRKQHVRQLRKTDALLGLGQARHDLGKNLEEIEGYGKDASRKQRIKRQYVLRTSGGLIDKSNAVDFDTNWREFEQKYNEMDPTERGTFNKRLGYNSNHNLTSIHPGVTQDLGARRMDQIKSHAHGAKYDGEGMKHLKFVGRVGGGALIGAAAIGAGAYVYDKHKGAHPAEENDKRFRDHLPESISYPSADLKVTKRRTIPTNAFTDALDIGGEKLPVAWRVAKKENTIVQLRNRKDVSGDVLHTNGQILGGVKLNASTVPGIEQDGSWTNSLFYTQKTEKGRYIEKPGEVQIKGKSVPIHFKHGDKNRYKRGDLSTSNPNKLDQEAREKIALTIIKGQHKQGEAGRIAKEFEYEYGDDPKIADMVNDERQREALRRKYDYLYMNVPYGAGRDSISRADMGWEPESGRHYREGRFGMGQSEQEYYMSEDEKAYWGSQATYGDTFGKSIEYVGGERFAATAKKGNKQGVPTFTGDTLPGQVADTMADRQERQRKRHLPQE